MQVAFAPWNLQGVSQHLLAASEVDPEGHGVVVVPAVVGVVDVDEEVAVVSAAADDGVEPGHGVVESPAGVAGAPGKAVVDGVVVVVVLVVVVVGQPRLETRQQ